MCVVCVCVWCVCVCVCLCVRKRAGHGWGKAKDYEFVTVSCACPLHISTVLPSPLSPLQSFLMFVYRINHHTFSKNTWELPVMCNTQFADGNNFNSQHTHTSFFPKNKKYLLTWICDHTMIKCLCVGVSITNNGCLSICPVKKETSLNYTQQTFVGHSYWHQNIIIPIGKKNDIHKPICLWMPLPTASCFSFGLCEIVSSSIPPWISLTQTTFPFVLFISPSFGRESRKWDELYVENFGGTKKELHLF